MPSDMLFMDTNFPVEKEGQSLADQVREIRNYDFDLLQHLRHTLRNLGMENFNKTEISRLTELIAEPIQAQIEGEDGALAQLSLSAEGLALQLSDLENNVTTLGATVSGISLSVQSGVGGAFLRLNNGSNPSDVSLTLAASATASDQTSFLELKSGSAVLASANIVFSGLVSFTAIGTAQETTFIHGGNIETGTLSANKITTGTLSANRVSGGILQGVKIQSSSGSPNLENVIINNGKVDFTIGTIGSGDISYGQLYPDYYNGRLFLYTPYILKLQSGSNSSWESTSGDLYLAANGDVVITGTRLVFNGTQIA